MFRVPAGLSVNFRQLSVQLQDLQAILSATVGHSHKLLQLSIRLWYLLQLSVRLRDLPSTFITFSCGQRTIHKRPLTFCVTAGPSSTSIKFPCACKIFVYFCQMGVRQASLNFPYYRASMHSVSLRQLYAFPQDHLSTSRASEAHSVNFRQLFVRPRDYPSNFVSAEHSVIFSYHSVHSRDLASTFRASAGHSVNFPCIHETFCQLPSTLSASTGPCVKFSCQWDIQSTLRPFVVPSVKFGLLSVYVRYLLSTSVNILCVCGTSQNILCSCWTFYQLQSTIRAALGPFVNFLCIRQTFSQLSGRPRDFHQLSVQPRDLPSTFCMIVGPSVNLSQLSMPLWGLWSNFRVAAGLSVSIPCGQRTILQLFLRPRDSLSTSVNFLRIRGTLRQFSCICGTVHKLPSTFRASWDLL